MNMVNWDQVRDRETQRVLNHSVSTNLILGLADGIDEPARIEKILADLRAFGEVDPPLLDIGDLTIGIVLYDNNARKGLRDYFNLHGYFSYAQRDNESVAASRKY